MRNWILKNSFIFVFALALPFSSAFAGAINFWGSYSNVNVAQQDITKPVTAGRSYFTTSVEEIPNGAKLIVETYFGSLNSPLSLWLQVAVNDGKGSVLPIPFKLISDNVKDNPTNYYSRREFNLDYADLNAELQKVLPATAKHLVIGPGTPLFVFGKFHEYNHEWGSIGRGGIFFMPEKQGATEASTNTGTNLRRPTELDLAYPITELMGLKYNNLADATLPGLKIGGQIQSRMEAEGKYQIPDSEMDRIRKQLFDIANDPVLAQKILGADWKITPELRYMKKDPTDPAGEKLLLDAQGLPTPDPMVDTYYDSNKFEAAKNDIAIRYRWTEGNGKGSWNFKPGLTQTTPDGIVERLEYAVDTTDDKPETVKKFADSMDQLNPFRLIRNVIPGSTPSDFLLPAVKITDTRYKFKLQHKSGLVIEVSLDYVEAASLRQSGKTTRFGQMEMDVDHPATSSNNLAESGAAFSFVGLTGEINPQTQSFLDGLKQDAFLDGRPVIHSSADLNAASPLKQKIGADLKIASDAIVALRDAVIGKGWVPGAQKNAYATFALEHLQEGEASKSVKTTLAAAQKAAAANVQAGKTNNQPVQKQTQPTQQQQARHLGSAAGKLLKCGPGVFN